MGSWRTTYSDIAPKPRVFFRPNNKIPKDSPKVSYFFPRNSLICALFRQKLTEWDHSCLIGTELYRFLRFFVSRIWRKSIKKQYNPPFFCKGNNLYLRFQYLITAAKTLVGLKIRSKNRRHSVASIWTIRQRWLSQDWHEHNHRDSEYFKEDQPYQCP